MQDQVQPQMLTLNVVDASKIPHTNERVLLITEEELARVKNVIAHHLHVIYEIAAKSKDMARALNRVGEKSYATAEYKFRQKMLDKAKVLAEAQHSLKYKSLSMRDFVKELQNNNMLLVKMD